MSPYERTSSLRYLVQLSMSARLGVASLAVGSSVALVFTFRFRVSCLLIIGRTTRLKTRMRMPPAATIPSQKGLSCGFFILVSLLGRSGGGLAGLFAHGHFEGDV